MFIDFLFKLLSKVSFKFYYRLKAKSQNDNKEAIELLKISKKAKINKSFIEFGFHPYELNSHIFLRKDKNPGLSPLNPIEAYKECTLRNLWSNTTAKEQWKIIQNLEYENLN